MSRKLTPLMERMAIASAIVGKRDGMPRIREIRKQLRMATRAKDWDLAFDLACELDEAQDRPRHGRRS
jgi:hypothetical protein